MKGPEPLSLDALLADRDAWRQIADAHCTEVELLRRELAAMTALNRYHVARVNELTATPVVAARVFDQGPDGDAA